MKKYLLGIDNGSTVSKAAIFDFQGNEVAIASCHSNTEYPFPGWTERNMDELWAGTANAIQKVLSISGINPAHIAGIGTTGHGNGLYLLDVEGKPLRNGIQSMDSRAKEIVDDWNRRNLHELVFPFTIQSFWAAQPNALLSWIKVNEPENYERIGAILMCKDYIKYCLTGEISSDFTDMSGTSLMDVRNRRYSLELLAFYGLSECYEALPPLTHSFDIVGEVTKKAAEETGMLAGTPVVGGVFDIDASAVGSGAISPGQACIIAGTWSINEVITEEALIDPNIFMTTLFASPGYFLSTEASATSATNLEWFVAQCCGDERMEAQKRGVSVYEICNEKVASVEPGSTNILFHPFLFDSNVHQSARAGFFGLAGWHTRAHLLRALYEGVVFGHLSHINRLRDAGAIINSARLTGGGSRSEVWSQIFADTLQIPMEITNGTEIGARGAALSAGIGVGVYKDYPEAVGQAVKLIRVYEPKPENSSLYLARFEEYNRSIESLQSYKISFD